jgi:hypothetical protein
MSTEKLPPLWARKRAYEAVYENTRWDPLTHVAEALAAAHEAGWNEACEAAAKESESWWPLFQFDTFNSHDTRRAANPNQIATRIRMLKKRGGG